MLVLNTSFIYHPDANSSHDETRDVLRAGLVAYNVITRVISPPLTSGNSAFATPLRSYAECFGFCSPVMEFYRSIWPSMPYYVIWPNGSAK
jgi:hypothetical protein